MKTLLLFSFLTLSAAIALGQQIEITINGAPHVSGTQYNMVSDTNTVSLNASVKNISGGTMQLTIIRKRLNPIASWSDELCWSSNENPLEAQCYGHKTDNPWETPDIQTFSDGGSGMLLMKVKPKDPEYGCGDYRYYVMNGSIALDSVDLSVCKTAAVEELTPALSITVAPNPVNSFVTVKTNSTEGTTVKMVDVLGNVVLKETVMGSSKTINTESFRNGIYFVIVEAENQRPINRKVIVRH